MNTPERFEALIEKVVFGGDGLTRAPDGAAVFVPGVLAGECAVLEIAERRKNFVRARVVKLVSPSPHRVEPDCPLCGRCAGCCYRHMDYATELEVKQGQLEEKLRGVDPGCVFAPPCASPRPDGYRDKLTLHVRKAGARCELGFVENDNASLADVAECRLALPGLNAKLAELRSDPGFFHTLRDGMKLVLRFESATGRVHVYRNSPDPKASWLKETLPFGTFSVPLGSFFQMNREAAALLLGEFTDAVRGASRVFDLYCGAGLFACAAAAAGVPETVGVELDASAVKAAEFNLGRFPATRARFAAGDAARELKTLLREANANDLAVVDPPRTGLSGSALNAIARSGLARLIYVSCHSSTLARDAAALAKSGFRLKRARLFDLFPRTAHFETFSVLER